MSCERFGALLGVFASGELEGDEADAFVEHMEACASCAGRLADLEEGVHDPVPAGPPVIAEPAADAPRVRRHEWERRWDAIESAVLPGQAGRPDELAAARAARGLVRALIPLAASVLVALTAYGYGLVQAHGSSRQAAVETALVTLDVPDDAVFGEGPR